MTQQYLVGELSQILGDLRAVATSEAAVREIGRLRHEAESTPPGALAGMVRRAMELTNQVCWDTLEGGDATTFVREVTICGKLREFGICAGLLEEEQMSDKAGHL